MTVIVDVQCILCPRIPSKKDLPLSWDLNVSLGEKEVNLNITKKDDRYDVRYLYNILCFLLCSLLL